MKKNEVNIAKEVYKSLNDEFKKKFEYSEEAFKTFFTDYILGVIDDEEITRFLHTKVLEKGITVFEVLKIIKDIEYLDNQRVLLRAIKVVTLLEISKDSKEFQRYNKRLKHDKTDIAPVDFEKVLKGLLKVKKE